MNTPLHTNQHHHNSNFGFALADSAVLAETKLILSHPDDTNKFQLDIDPQRRLKDGRKVSVVAQYMDAPPDRQDAIIIYGEELGFVQYAVTLRPDSTCSLTPIEGIDHPIVLNLGDFAEGEYELRISLHVKTPRIAEGPLEPEQHAMVKYAQVVTVAICLFPAEVVQMNEVPETVWTRDNHVFDSYGSGGFILADLPRMAKRVEDLIGSGSHNLIEQFSEGDLSDTLLEEGLMAIAWGVTPWCYSIYSAPDEHSRTILSVDKLGEEPQTTGIYRVHPEIKQLSIVPVNELAYWPSCAEKAWPVIDVPGEGETLRMDLYVQICESVNGLHENPLPSFVLTRSEGQPEAIIPLIDVVIVD
ncbi:MULTISPECIES: hypothetical protein [unclassified Paenibacillus]|uniref:hypothetical protein n=1 Tax=unclassified Paenibacillus TaxID=185978 RepID=UPI0009A8C82F|nr:MULTISPECIES: hypothetical protein [unclassified Paenibacillus]SLK09611.1 hypothetical protein SAMN06272722_106134 [Paenibacillus sp. RU5A]SOC71630.1 hypothetical protein SAMN05880581_106134 [Paenibacillus sp. RU26A]SOC74022.1 hypothetical protein SAMN05880586_106134 [Paenibacillus sp. RU5M]